MRILLSGVLALSLSLSWLAAEEPKEVRTIAFASCLKQDLPAPALQSVVDCWPDVFVWMGDNVYADTEDMAVMRSKYDFVRSLAPVRKLWRVSTVVGTWDDHDYGANDYGKEYPMKEESQQLFLDFIGEPADSERRRQEGVYGLHDLGTEGRRVRVILLDTRYHRDPVGSDGTMLGELQWRWLERALKESPAQVNVLVSSIQVLASEHRFEKWSNFPRERARLLALLARPDIPPVVVVSGDRHMSEISRDDESCGYPLYDITSSSLNLPLGSGPEPNRYRVGELFRPSNFGTLSLDWSHQPPVVTACIRDERGAPQRAVSFRLERRTNG